jgi:hypothetical protein
MSSLIGKKPNQVPVNGYLGRMAYQDASYVYITGGKILGLSALEVGTQIAATAGVTTQASSSMRWTGTAWNTTTTVSKTNSIVSYLQPYSGTTTYAKVIFAYKTKDGAANATPLMSVGEDGITALSGTLNATETTTPVAAAGVVKVYGKTNNNLFFQDGDGVEHMLASVDQIGGFKNKIINGDMCIAQRATEVAAFNSMNGYTCLDRYYIYSGNTSGYIARVAGEGEFPHMMKIGRTAGTSSTGVLQPMYALESVDCIPLRGKTVTVSWYAKAGANFSSSSDYMSFYLASGTGTNQSPVAIAGWTGITYPAATAAQAITTTLTRYSLTGVIPANCNQLGFFFSYSPAGTAGADDNLYITGIQLEVGSAATAFEHLSYAENLRRCQRYYYKVAPGVVSSILGSGFANNTTVCKMHTQFPVQMRIAPTVLEQDGVATDYAVTSPAGAIVCSAVPTFSSLTNAYSAQTNFSVASGLTAGDGVAGITAAGTTAGYLGWPAEL